MTLHLLSKLHLASRCYALPRVKTGQQPLSGRRGARTNAKKKKFGPYLDMVIFITRAILTKNLESLPELRALCSALGRQLAETD